MQEPFNNPNNQNYQGGYYPPQYQTNPYNQNQGVNYQQTGYPPYNQPPYSYTQQPYQPNPYANAYSHPFDPKEAERSREIYLKRKKEKNEILKLGFAIGIVLVCYLIVQLIAVSVMTVLGLTDVYSSSATFQYCFNVVAVHLLSLVIPFGILSLIMKNKYDGPVVPTKKVGFFNSCVWISFGMGCCIIANYATNIIINLFKMAGYELSQSNMLEPDGIFSCIAMVIATAIIPGVCEEFAMRCCTLGLLKKHGKAFGVIAVSVVFGLIHGNVIQFVFAFLVGLVLAFITVKTDSVVPAMFIHTFNNGLSVTQDIIKYVAGEKTAENVVVIMFIVWGVLAIASLVYLVIKKQFTFADNKEKKEKDGSELSLGTKLVMLLPGFAVPFILLIIETATTVTKI